MAKGGDFQLKTRITKKDPTKPVESMDDLEITILEIGHVGPHQVVHFEPYRPNSQN